ncbi:hypothetical protein SAMN04488491_1890 [Psychrobacter sp. LV10R520-6]|nr:hypothetical protein [Psychrobacter sp. LV10R520-6]SNT70709.1 hypothetical protein SAMN04488491_1890 [Psychrobacter sp. LV10R520-6]
MPPLLAVASHNVLFAKSAITKLTTIKKAPAAALLTLFLGCTSYVHADSMSALIAQKSAQPELMARYTRSSVAVPAAKISTRSTIQRVRTDRTNAVNPRPASSLNSFNNFNNQVLSKPIATTSYRYPDVQRQSPAVLPTFLSGSYDNVDSEYLPLLSRAETQSSTAAREVISTARAMALNERTIIQGGCWDYLNAVFNRAGVTRDTVHKGAYSQGPYANSSEIEVGDWLYYINHGYNGVEHSGLFVGWVDEADKQALILSYAGESRREPARYRVYDLSNVYQIMRPTV